MLPTIGVVEGLIPKGGIGFISGDPKVRKSLFLLDLCVHLVHAKPWLGRYATDRTAWVLYISMEDGAERLQSRILDINRSYGFPPLPLIKTPCERARV